VTQLSQADVAEIDSLRAALERLAVEQVVAKATKADLAAVADAVEHIERARDEVEAVRCDIDFHDAVYAAAGHRRLEEAWRAIRSQVHLFLLSRVRISAQGYLAHIPGEHRELVAALRGRDPAAAVELFAAHRRHAFDVLVDTTHPQRDDQSGAPGQRTP
jgi:DNA-binding GntR family transcriptional regulator